MTGALDGITVIDLSRGAAGALATMFMCDHGARVIRVAESAADVLRPGGYRIWDRGKEVVVDAPAGDALAGEAPGRDAPAGEAPGRDASARARLIAAADVVIEDFSPASRPPEFHPAALHARHPRLVTCSITAYGELGTLRDEPAIDDLVLARLGILAGLPGFRQGLREAPATGPTTEPATGPVHAAHPLPSVGAGLLAALGIAAALYGREETNRGRHVATSLVAGALLYHPKVVGERLEPNVFQTNPYGSAPFYSVYECGDGEWIQLGCVHPGFIARAGDLMGIAETLADPIYGKGQFPRTPAADADLRALVGDVMRTRPSAHWVADFEARDIPFARAQTTEQAMADPQVAHNGMLVTLDDPEVGRIEAMGAPIKMSTTPTASQRPRSAEPSSLVEVLASLGEQPASATLPPAPLTSATPPDTATISALPLAGVRVLEITNLIAGPIAGRLLADIGADVIKLEPPAGDISRPIGRTYFYSSNFAKRSVAVDTATDAGKAIVRRIAATCDVVLANLRPGATARMGLGIANDPDVIETLISGYGLDGPYAHRPGIDPLAQALMGMERAQGGSSNPPSFTAQLAPTDFTTGTMAALGTVLALYARRRGRARGQQVAVNLLDGAIVLSSEWFTRYRSKPQRPLADRGQHGPHLFHRLYRCRDAAIYVAADTPDAAARLLTVLGIEATPAPEHFAIIGALHPNGTTLAGVMAEAFASRKCTEILARLRAAGIPCAPALPPNSEVFFADPAAAANGWSVTQMHPTVGNLTAVCRYITFDGAEDGRDAIRPTPLLGQHVDEALTEAGYTAAEITELRAQGLVVTSTNGP